MKTELLRAGVAEQRMKVIRLGEEGVVCVDTSDICRHVNRRVHLEIRRFGQEHMAAPATLRSADPTEPQIDASPEDSDTWLPANNLQLLSPEPTSGS